MVRVGKIRQVSELSHKVEMATLGPKLGPDGCQKARHVWRTVALAIVLLVSWAPVIWFAVVIWCHPPPG